MMRCANWLRSGKRSEMVDERLEMASLRELWTGAPRDCADTDAIAHSPDILSAKEETYLLPIPQPPSLGRDRNTALALPQRLSKRDEKIGELSKTG
jgi:hypothetical protein